MSSIIIRCPFCSKKNRIPSDKVGQRAKCGACGQIIVDAGTNYIICNLCKHQVSNGLSLSNGDMIHESCLQSLQAKEQEINDEILAQHEKLSRLRRKIDRHKGVVFRIVSIFSKPSTDIADIEKETTIIQEKIEKLSRDLVSLNASSARNYDYFLTYPPDWEARRKQVVERDNDQCSKCGSLNNLHLHHIKPLSKGGNNKIANLRLLCENCHSKEHGGRDFSGEFNRSETAFSKRVANIRYAIENGRQIKFGYKKPTDKGHKQRVVNPGELINIPHVRDSGSTLCVRGYCELRKAERTFALKRMRGLKVI